MVCALVVRKLGRAVNRKQVLRVMRERRLIQRRRRLDRRRRPLEVNQGKRSIAIDLTHEEGRDVLHRLIADTDVPIHNALPRRSSGSATPPLRSARPTPRTPTSAMTAYRGLHPGG
jgi:crotonobetainyl-CoA:carnitine CoA-transferase CaiB-like acyl-CoA transferase